MTQVVLEDKIMQDDKQQPTHQPSQPMSLGSSGRVIQPVSDMSEYVNQTTVQPVAAPTPVQAVDPSKIYPSAATPTYQPASTPPNTNQKEATTPNSQRVASRVPGVQVYAFLIIIFSLFSVIALASVFHTTRIIQSSMSSAATASAYSRTSPLLLLAFGVATINITVGAYLLVAKNIKTVSALLTALLIIGGLGLINSLISTARVISHVNAGTVISLLISVGLLMYLWNIKSQVDLASVS